MFKILLVDDSEDIHNLVKKTLGESYALTSAMSLAEATKCLEEQRYDLLLLDVVLPDGDGFEYCSSLFSREQTEELPVVFLTSKGSTSDKVTGFSLGADDYIVKPFEPIEFKARIEAKLKKKSLARVGGLLEIGDLFIDIPFQRAYVMDGQTKKTLNLTPIEYKLLLFLARQEGQTLSREKLMTAVWGDEVHVMNRSIDTHVSALRKKLGSRSWYVRSVYGSGYCFSIQPKSAKKAG